MNDDRGSSDGNWSFSKLQRMDAVCDEFERAWTTSAPLAIEQLLVQNHELPRSTLLDQLLRLELHLRRAAGESPLRDHYQQRFPTDDHVVSLVWEEFVANGKSLELSSTATLHKNLRSPAPLPESIGRFQIRRFLGRGSFGAVYLAFDPNSGNEVALKVPHPEKVESARRLEDLWQEFLTAKHLDHPNLVRTLSVEDNDGRLVIVQQFIDGQNLTDWYAETRPTPERVVRLLIPVAKALGYLHEQGVFHRDLKPGNILVDRDDNPYVADFGLALHEDQQRDPIRRGELAGTYAYMAPEQVRRQTQLLDGQTDLWSFGVILYRLLTDRFPFGGPPPRNRADVINYQLDLEFEIEEHDPRPPRQINPTVTRKLEQICLRCLEKRKRDRYQTGHDLAEDLRLVLERSKSAILESSWETKVQIVPKGLRSFDAADAPFFLELLPGPRTLDGIPVSLNFWKSRLSDSSGEGPIDLGVVYGPSGCGKSSFIRAGLIPLLGDKFVPLVIESTPEDTEVRLLKALRKALPDLPRDGSLVDACRRVGERGAGSGRKVLLIFDQFEQWLHAHPSPDEQQLVEALRNCNGTRLQALLLVRDDFWMPLTRVMDQLEIPLQENNNIAVVDLFDCDHARKVLLGLGRAYGRLPCDDKELTAAQKHFLSSAVDGLAQDRRIICVRLALFAEMMKDRPWTHEELMKIGGAKGIGVAFLDEKFGPNAVAVYRPHRAAARKILAALLPPFGSNIKGQMKTVTELHKEAGCATVSSFEQLIGILDRDLKLLTPVVPDQTFVHAAAVTNATEPLHYQFTHDYLVPSVREWLTTDLRRNPAGRAMLCLRERSDDWSRHPEPRRLPSLMEWMSICWYVPRRTWSSAQHSVMNTAGRKFGYWSVGGCLTMLIILFAGVLVRNRLTESQRVANVNGLINQLLVAEIAQLPGIVSSLDEESDLAVPLLISVADDPGRTDADRMRATFALARGPGGRAARLIEFASSADLLTLRVIRDRLAPFADTLKGDLWDAVRRDRLAPSSQLRFGALLAVVDPNGSDWDAIAPSVVAALVAENTLDLDSWAEIMRSKAAALIPNLRERFFDESASSTERVAVARILARYGDAALLTELLFAADAHQFSILIPGTLRCTNEIIVAVRQTLEQSPLPATDEERISHAKRLRNATFVFLRLDQLQDAQPLLANSSHPTARTMSMVEMRDFGVPPEVLLKTLSVWKDPSARQAILLALEPYRGNELGPQMEQDLIDKLCHSLQYGQHQAERSAAEWVLLHWGHKATVARLTQNLEQTKPLGMETILSNGWWITGQGQRMSIIRGPSTFQMGSPEAERWRESDDQTLTLKTIPYSFAVGTKEVSVEQFRRFQPGAEFAWVSADAQCPANKVSFDSAIQYCQWLSEQEGIPSDQMCYPTESEPPLADASLPEHRLMRNGYRLLTEAEWEFICRAGAVTPWLSGVSEESLKYFAWFSLNAGERVHSVGLLRPNTLGLFDVAGNVEEWCHSSMTNGKYPLRGGGYNQPPSSLRSARRHLQSRTGYSYTGFRIARTFAPVP